ncbi:MAG: glycine cleavage system protein GcvH [Syntrophobacteraceae bacterium]|nr:glycine cleavage system protein GcvH [Syntrophobacteraceae bacterium]
MKEISQLATPSDVRYTLDHEWARVEGDIIRIGVTDYAQDRLGDIVFVEAPRMGKKYAKGEECGALESVKAVGEVYAPVGGEIAGVNVTLEGSPGLVNSAPYTDGWIAEVKPVDPTEMDGLMTSEQYIEMLKGFKE